jgi:hypothetical protein
MHLSQWLQQLGQRWSPRGGNRRRAAHVPAPTRRRVRPILEALEDRCLLSSLTINPALITYGKATTTITGFVTTDTANTSGLADINVSITLNGVTQNPPLDPNSGDFSTTFDTSKLGVSGSPYKISGIYPGDAKNSGATGSASLIVMAALPSFSNLSLSSSTITYGTPTVTLSGHLNSGSDQLVPAGETITVGVLGSQGATATLDGNDDFSCTLDTHAVSVIPPPPNSPQSGDLSNPISVSYGGDGNFMGAVNLSLSLTVTPATPSFSNPGAPVITYGTTTTAITGHLDSGSAQPVHAGEPVTVTLTTRSGLTGFSTDAPLDANDNFSATLFTGQLHVLDSPYLLDFSYDGDNNFNRANDNSTLTVVPATPTFSNLSALTIPAGTATTAVSGHLNANAGQQPVPAGEFITINVTNGQHTDFFDTGTGLDNNDNFSTSIDTSQLNVSGSPYTIIFSYDGSFNVHSDFKNASASSTLTVTPAPSAPIIARNPSNQTVKAGQTATFTAAASGNPTPTVQWQVSSDGGKTFSNLGGATTLTLTNVQASQNGYKYRAVFTNSAGSATTSAATLTVQYAPTVTTNPSNQTVTATGSATFTAAANGNPPPSVQWQVSSNGGQFSNISGATGTTLTLTNVSAAMSGNAYQAVFTNSLGSAATSPATLTVLEQAVSVNPAWANLAPGTHPDGSPPGTVIGVNAFASLQAAANATAAGGIATLAAGTYNGSLTLDQSIILAGSGSGTTVLSGQGSGIGLSVTAPGVELHGLTVRGFAAGLAAGSATTYLALDDVHFTGNPFGVTVKGVATVLVSGGSGDDTFFVRPGALARQGEDPLYLSGVHNLTVDGGGGSNRLVVYLDDTNAPDTVWINSAAIARDHAPFLLWYRSAGGSLSGGLAVVLGNAPTTVVVQGQPTGVPLTVYGGGGDDTFDVAVTANSAYAGLLLDGGAGNDTLAVFDLSGGATMQNVVTVIGQGEVDVSYAGAVASRILYQNLEQVLGTLPEASS